MFFIEISLSPQNSLSSLRDDNIRASVTAKAKKAKSPDPPVVDEEEEEHEEKKEVKKAKTVVKGPPQATSSNAKPAPKKKQQEEEPEAQEEESDDTGGGEPEADAGDNGELQKMDLEEPEPQDVPEVTGPAEDDNVPVSHKDRQPAPANTSMDVIPEPAVSTPKKQQQPAAAAPNGQKKAAKAVAPPKPHVVFFEGTVFCAAASLDELLEAIKNETPDGIEKDKMVIHEIEEAWRTFLTDLGAEPELKELIGYQLDDLKAANVVGCEVTLVMA